MFSYVILFTLAAFIAGIAAWLWRRSEFDTFRSRLADFAVRARTWLIVVFGVLLQVLPDLLHSLYNDPDFAAVVPEAWLRWIGIATLLLALWSRWRLASRASDPEVQVVIAAKAESAATGEAVALMTKTRGEAPQLVATVPPKGG